MVALAKIPPNTEITDQYGMKFSVWDGKLALVGSDWSSAAPTTDWFNTEKLERRYTVRYATDDRGKRIPVPASKDNKHRRAWIGYEPHILNPRAHYEDTGFTTGVDMRGTGLRGGFEKHSDVWVKLKLSQLSRGEGLRVTAQWQRDRDLYDASDSGITVAEWKKLLAETSLKQALAKLSTDKQNKLDAFLNEVLPGYYTSDETEMRAWRSIQGVFFVKRNGAPKAIVRRYQKGSPERAALAGPAKKIEPKPKPKKEKDARRAAAALALEAKEKAAKAKRGPDKGAVRKVGVAQGRMGNNFDSAEAEYRRLWGAWPSDALQGVLIDGWKEGKAEHAAKQMAPKEKRAPGKLGRKLSEAQRKKLSDAMRQHARKGWDIPTAWFNAKKEIDASAASYLGTAERDAFMGAYNKGVADYGRDERERAEKERKAKATVAKATAAKAKAAKARKAKPKKPKLRKVEAFSVGRHKASGGERAQYGGDTVTTFAVSYYDDPSTRRNIEGKGRLPGHRRTHAIKQFRQLVPPDTKPTLTAREKEQATLRRKQDLPHAASRWGETPPKVPTEPELALEESRRRVRAQRKKQRTKKGETLLLFAMNGGGPLFERRKK